MRRVLAVALAATLAATPALADRIDGNWCSAKGARIAISGVQVTTPDGTAMTGNYARHAFSYVAPAGDIGSGQTVLMRLLSDEFVQVQMGEAGQMETWRRCNPAVSLRDTQPDALL